MSEATPLIQQYLSIKKNYPHELVFFQVGDFFELFFEDAKIASSELSITLTKRGFYKGTHIPLCGIPVHMIEQYYPKLVKKGYSVIICTQKNESQLGKIVERHVSEIITPGSIISDDISDSIYTLFITRSDSCNITSFLFEFQKQEIIYQKYSINDIGLIAFSSMLEKYKPKEIITTQEELDFFYTTILIKSSIKSFEIKMNDINIDINHFLNRYKLDISFYNLGLLFTSYLSHYFKSILEGGSLLVIPESAEETLFLDTASIRYLECVHNLDNESKKNTIYEFLDHTKTKMGSRLLKKWILNPLNNQEKIQSRHKYIESFILIKKKLEKIEKYLSVFGDLEKLFSRLRLGKMREKDFFSLYQFANTYTLFIEEINNISIEKINALIVSQIPLSLIEDIKNIINVDSTIKIQDIALIINPFSNSELQEKFNLINNQGDILNYFLEQEKIKTGITDLNIKKTPLYNYVFELSKLKDKKNIIPDSYLRVQTLANRERYTSPELQELSHELIHAEDDYFLTEKKIKDTFIKNLIQHIQLLLSFSQEIAELDVYFSLTSVAIIHQLKKPEFANNNTITIIEGKHPIAHQYSSHFIANSLTLKKNKKNYLITGPNMGGKSTFMRQNAVIILLAHIGSFVSAKSCQIQIVDKILTRVGASDNIHSGKSTFFIELEEILTILKMASENSFVIIDEIGRGTSTYDGISLATSIIEYLVEKINPYFLCSTHYHEISQLIKLPNIHWYHMNAIINNDAITFLYTISEGQAKNSMGISLAKTIGFPQEIIDSAWTYFDKINKNTISSLSTNNHEKIDNKENEKKLTDNQHIFLEIKNILSKKSINDISRNEAFEILENLHKIIFEKKYTRK